MGNEITLEQLNAEARLLTKERNLILAANAGFGDVAARELQQYADQNVSPGLITDIGARLIDGVETSGIRGDRTYQITLVADVIANTLNLREDEGMVNEHIFGLINNRRSQAAQSAVILSFQRFGLINNALQEEHADIDENELSFSNDELYDFLGQEERLVQKTDIKEGIYKGINIKPLIHAKNAEQLKDALGEIYVQYGLGSDLEREKDLLDFFNGLCERHINDFRTPFVSSIQYFKARIGLGDENHDIQHEQNLRFTIDQKRLSLINNYLFSHFPHKALELIEQYGLMTDVHDERYMALQKNLDEARRIVIRQLDTAIQDYFSKITPEDFLYK